MKLTELEKFGINLAKKLEEGSVVALIGDLGAGKTTLTKAIALGLGISETVTSPTFLTLKEYRGKRLDLYHFDLYRISSWQDMIDAGFDEYIFGDGVCIIEWADRIIEFLPENTIKIELCYGEKEDERIVKIYEPSGN